ncbi:aminoacyl-tRNA hydrolase [Nitrosomonas mobilis]|uniref:aminoacyl-tRNA hydrolase n=1 Tax=Nitrosomonas mobilis TaxID=51642 RepID=UPI001FDF59CF|nr:aminoacyl-tRNA hydrolase [Nitrosomonas mobilis]
MVLAKAYLHRMRLSKTKFIGITGSAGKTTTTNLCRLILSAFYPVTGSQGSLNTPFATAETLLATEKKHEFCILEIGGFKTGALDLPMRLFTPKISVLTNIGKEHISAFKGKGEGVEGIAAEKAKLIKALPVDGTAVLNIDDARVKAIGEQCRARIIWVGRDEGAIIRLLEATSRYPESLKLKIAYQGKTYKVITQLHGTQLALSVLSALGVAVAAGISLEDAIPPLVEAQPEDGRMQIVDGGEGVTFIRDDYKAPLWSLYAPLEYLGEAIATRKIAVIGSVSDFYGDKYKQFAREARKHADIVIFVGQSAHRALRARKDENDQALQGFATMRETADYLRKILQPGDLVLLKGSSKVDHLERLVLDRQQAIQCWRERCGLEIFCYNCSQQYKESSTSHSTQLTIYPIEANEAVPTGVVHPGTTITTVIVGLGNPGKEYENTVHNIGYRVIDTLATRHNGIWQTVETGQVCSIELNDATVKLFKPDAFMNLTGPKLQHFLTSTGCPPSHCIIVHDDMDIELGKVKYKREGGDAGHRGVKSCLAALGTYAVPRIRFGVREPGSDKKAGEQVLTDFSATALTQLPQLIEQAMAKILQTIPETTSPDI